MENHSVKRDNMPESIDVILKMAEEYYSNASLSLEKFAIIKKLPNGKYRVLSHKGRNLGTYTSKDKAKNRLRQVEYFKHKGASHADDVNLAIDLTKAEEFSFSAIMRQVRQNSSPKQVREFLTLYKSYFDKAVKANVQKPEHVALQNSIVTFSKKHKLNLDENIIKNAAITELGDPNSVGRYLADMIKFIMRRISSENRQKALNTIKHKVYYLHESDIANKNLPASAAMGQSITLVKNVLFNHDPKYIREVINTLVRSL